MSRVSRARASLLAHPVDQRIKSTLNNCNWYSQPLIVYAYWRL